MRAVVLASGACNLPDIPACAGEVPRSIDCLTAQLYRNPGQLADGGVLVVGASASGTQIAHEIRRTGREVYLSVGEHIRAPRMYRGRDIQWWMDAAGVQNERYDAVDDIARARRVPSLQLAGTTDRSTLDLNALSDIGVTLVGRLAGIADGKAQFAGSLRNMCTLSDLKMERLLGDLRCLGARKRRRWFGRAAAPACRRRGSRTRRCSSLDLGGRSGPSSGRPAIGPTIRGSTCRCSTARA